MVEVMMRGMQAAENVARCLFSRQSGRPVRPEWKRVAQVVLACEDANVPPAFAIRHACESFGEKESGRVFSNPYPPLEFVRSRGWLIHCVAELRRNEKKDATGAAVGYQQSTSPAFYAVRVLTGMIGLGDVPAEKKEEVEHIMKGATP